MSLITKGDAYVGDIGTPIVVEVVDDDGADVDVSAAAALVYRVAKPDGTAEEWTASAGTETNEATYSVVDGDFDQSGQYKLQLYTDATTWSGWSDVFYVMVRDPLAAPEA